MIKPAVGMFVKTPPSKTNFERAVGVIVAVKKGYAVVRVGMSVKVKEYSPFSLYKYTLKIGDKLSFGAQRYLGIARSCRSGRKIGDVFYISDIEIIKTGVNAGKYQYTLEPITHPDSDEVKVIEGSFHRHWTFIEEE